jgi:hypothetical protein
VVLGRFYPTLYLIWYPMEPRKSPALTRHAPCVERHPLAHIAPNASLRRESHGVIAVAGLGLGAGYLGCLAHWSGLREGAQEGPSGEQKLVEGTLGFTGGGL